MYLLTWNKNERKVEASFGGHVTLNEARVFIDELREILAERKDSHFDVIVDYSTTSFMDEPVAQSMEEAREICLFAGASRVTFITRNEREAAALTNNRLQGVLEGRERYMAFAC